MPYITLALSRWFDSMGSKAYTDKHRRAGLCYDCPSEVVEGRTRCEKCLVRNREYEKVRSPNRIVQRREDSKCLRCGRDLDLDRDRDNQCCLMCIEERIASSRR